MSFRLEGGTDPNSALHLPHLVDAINLGLAFHVNAIAGQAPTRLTCTAQCYLKPMAG
jgi:hypothetical protein